MTEQREPAREPAVEEPTEGHRWAPQPDSVEDYAAEVDPRLVDDDDATHHQASEEPAPGPVPEPEPVVAVPEPEPTPVDEPPVDPVSEPEPAPGPATTPAPAPDLASTDPYPTAETVALPGAGAAGPDHAIFRDSPVSEETEVEPLSDEARKLAAERAARKEAREAAFAATAPVPVVAPEPVVIKQRTNDRFAGSLGLFVLRLVVAAIFTVRGITMLTNLVETQEQFAQTLIPYPQVMAIVTGAAHLLIALSLILGLLTRVAGLGILLIAGGVLAFVMWGPWSPFVPGQAGFLGELELLLAAVGLLFLLVGAGGWSVDRSFRTARVRDKAERQMA